MYRAQRLGGYGCGGWIGPPLQADLYTVAAQIEHSAVSIDWFLHGMFSPSGFDLEFEKHIAEAKACASLVAARAHFKKAVDDACASLSSKGDGELMTLLPDDSIFAGVPRAAVIDGLVDHTAHHQRRTDCNHESESVSLCRSVTTVTGVVSG